LLPDPHYSLIILPGQAGTKKDLKFSIIKITNLRAKRLTRTSQPKRFIKIFCHKNTNNKIKGLIYQQHLKYDL